jgi:general secretion pathway protein A
LQIVLVGQPELDEKLDLPELRQLKQRIALRARLEPLDREETNGYIVSRLQIAGANSQASTLFPSDTIAEVYRQSRGIPRLINTICENALITAFARQLQSIPVDVVNEVAKEFRLNLTHWPRSERVAHHDNGENWQRENDLLKLHTGPQGIPAREGGSSSTILPGARKHEPYI